MEITKKQIDDLNLIVNVKVEKADIQPIVDKKLKEIRKNQIFPGFRAGTAPMSIIVKKFGKSVWWEELSRLAFGKADEYIKNENIKHFASPIMADEFEVVDLDKIETTEEFLFPFQLGLIPEFDDAELYKTKFTKYNIKIKDDAIDKIVEGYRRDLGKFNETEKAAEESMLRVELTQTDENKNIIESGIHIEKTSILLKVLSEDTKKIFVGVKANDEINTDLKKIISNSAELASMLHKTKEDIEAANELFFNIKVLEIKEFVLAEINQELFDSCFTKDTIKSEEEFRTKILEDLSNVYAQDSNELLKNDIRTEFKEQLKSIIPLPENFLKKYLSQNKEENETELTNEQLEANYDFLRWDLYINKILKNNEIKVDYEDVLIEAKKEIAYFMQKSYGMNNLSEETLESYVKEMLKNEKQVLDIELKVKTDKALDHIITLIETKSKKVSIEELEKIYKEKNNTEPENE